MTHGGARHRPSIQKKCPCGSGKKEKNCHGLRRGAAPVEVASRPLPAGSGPMLQKVTEKPMAELHPWGMPGEEHKVIVAPIFKGGESDPKKINIGGERGRYKVQFLLSRPGYPISKEREHQFIDNLVGESHIRIVKPEAERRMEDPEQILIQALGKNFKYLGSANKDGFLGKFVAELEADNAQAAENEAYGSLAPFLSAWSVNLDVPISVETIQVTNLTTQVSSLRVHTPHFDMNFGGGTPPFFVDDFCQYASIYREGLNTNSSFYRYLCFFKIIESVIARRGRQAGEKRAAGQEPRTPYERIPQKKEELIALLNCLYTWRKGWDEMTLVQVFPPEILGRKITAILVDHLRPLRLGIAHGLLEPGEITIVLDKIEHIQQVNKWLPLCRICARWMLLNEFPRECSIGMK